ncbi:hypothetical protein ES703_30591 [subsurface metagenome]
MPQKALAPEVIDRARALRSEGKTIFQVATELGISQGSASNATRGIAKPARRTQRHKEAAKPVPLTKPSGLEDKIVPDDTTIEAINKAREAEADTRRVRAAVERQIAMDELEDRRQQRQRLNDLEIKAREASIKESEARAKLVVSPSPELTLQLEQAKAETTRLDRELTEQKHLQHMNELQRGFQGQIELLSRQLNAIGRTNLGAYDIMAKSLDKAENLAIMAGDKVDKFVKSGREDKQLQTALSLGLTPDEYALLLQGEELVPTREDIEVGRRYRAHKDGVPYEEPEPGEYEGLVSLVQQRNRRWQAAMDKAQRAMGKGGSSVVRTGKPGQVPAPGEEEPVVLPADSKVVKCQRCGSTFDVDLNEARQYAAQGKKLFVNCAKCSFLLEITEMLPELQPAPGPEPVASKSTKPKCYEPGTYGECVSDFRSHERQCDDCSWSG